MATSTDVELTQAQKDKVDQLFNSAGLDPAMYRNWFSQQGTEWFFIPQGITLAAEANAVLAIATLVQAVAG